MKVNDVITAYVEVVALLEKNRVQLKTTCINQEGVIVLEGEALVVAPDIEFQAKMPINRRMKILKTINNNLLLVLWFKFYYRSFRPIKSNKAASWNINRHFLFNYF